ncbi:MULTISPECIES: 2Fe-2S iron-sulfur cluster-binding protein [Alcaligenaceae]|jgi:NAD(P)H-flavin reductase/ferredoxin|nr:MULTISPECIES: 2Fe-2S iron-sulfur cluster-binding protein [Alcaligenaceae]QIM47924.1 2Fe-2S iron-sulfur cluster binding domain-containing protein [Pusillimonas sp. DMV24BSW_D]
MSRYQIKVSETDISTIAAEGVSVLDACLEGGVALEYNCRSGECGECIATLVSGTVKELPGADPAIFNDGHRAEGKILACMCYPQSDLVLSTRLSARPQAAIGHHHVHVTQVIPHGPSIYEVRMLSDQPIDYEAGQYFEWVVPGVSSNRSYSVANRPGSCELIFHVKAYEHGEVSQYLKQGRLREGDMFELVGPYGTFGLGSQAEAPAVMVAGGTGLAPLCALLEEEFASGRKRQIRLFFGARASCELYWLDRLQQWAQKHPQFQYFPVIADPDSSPDWQGELGLVTDLMQRKLTDAMGYEAYLCGPPAMIDAVEDLLICKGIDESDLHADRFLAMV